MRSRNIHRHPPSTRRHDVGSAPAAGTCGEERVDEDARLPTLEADAEVSGEEPT